jgi:glycosyltransferase involved in cell wall biosynthesis
MWLLDGFNVGGAESLAVSYVRKYDRDRYELFVCSLKDSSGSAIETQLRDAGAQIVNLGARNLRDRRAFRRLLQLVRSEKIELIHAHLIYSSIWASVVSRITRVPAICSLHAAPPTGRDRRGFRDRIGRFVMNRWATLVVMVSDALRGEYRAIGGLADAKLRTVHNGIELQRFMRERNDARKTVESDFAIEAGAPLVVTVSVLRREKGIDVLLNAIPEILKHVPNARFLIVGEGEMREAWPRLADELGISAHVQWAGYRSDVYTFLAGCDLFVLPTFTDALPTVLMEAMAARLPIVASRVGGIPEIVDGGVTGLLVPPHDPAALAAAITPLLLDRERHEAMAAAAQREVVQRFSTEAWIARLDTIYDEALQHAKERA